MITFWTGASPGKIKAVLGKAIARANQPHKFVDVIYDTDSEAGDIVVAMGEEAVEQLRAKGVFGKKRTIASLRNAFVEAGGVLYTAMYDPRVTEIDAGKQQEMEWDVQLIARMHKDKSIAVPAHAYQWVDDFSALIARVKAQYALTNKAVPLAFDTETVGLSPFVANPEIVVVQISDRKGHADCWYVSEASPVQKLVIIEQLRWILTTPMIKQRGANLKFDFVWVKAVWDLDCTNFSMDTTLVGSLLDENRSNSLNMHAKIYAGERLGGYDDPLNAKFDKSRMDLVPKEDMLSYAGGDVDAVLEVSDQMLTELKAWPGLQRFYLNILHPAARTFEKIERTGLLVDRGRYEVLRHDLESEIARLEKAGLDLLPRRLKLKYLDNLSLGRAAILNDYFFTPMGLNLKPLVLTGKTRQPSTAKSHLEMFGNVPESKAFCAILDELGSAKKTLSTYVVGFLSHLRPDNRFHAAYLLHSGQVYEGESEDGGTVCLPAAELVLTDRGYLYAPQVKIGDHVLSHAGVPRKVVDVVDNGVKPLIEVTLANGLRLRTTLNHEYRTGETWTRADHLKVGVAVVTYGTAEEWRPVVDWEDYEVSSWARVRNVNTGTIMATQAKGKWGHRKTTLRRNGCQKRGPDLRDVPTHRLVARAFLGESSEEVRHLNGIAWDSSIQNLAYGSPKDNRMDSVEHGTTSKRFLEQAKLTEEACRQIRTLAETNKYFAKKFGVCERLIRAVRNGKRWGPRVPEGKHAVFSASPVASIRYLPAEPTYGLSVEEDHSHVTGGIVTHNTGRLSARDPAVQTIPKKTRWAKRIRECFICPPGKAMLSVDFSQGELRLAACAANEETMIAAYRAGIDLHVKTGAGLINMELEEFQALKTTDPDYFDSVRGRAKPANFGLIYGMGAEGYMNYSWAGYRMRMTLEQAEKDRNSFFATYPGLLNWHKDSKNIARRDGFIVSPLGRVRHLPLIRSPDRFSASKAERQAVNSPIQSTLSDLMLWSLAEVDRNYPQFEACAMIHDAGIFYVDYDKVDIAAQRITSIMADLPLEETFGWKPQLRFTADAEAGPDMAHLKKVAVH